MSQLKKIPFLLFLFCSTFVFAQLDGTKGFSIKPAKQETSDVITPIPAKTPSVFDKEPEKSPPLTLEKPEKNFMVKEEFKNPGDRYIDALNDKIRMVERPVLKEFSKDVYLGEIRTKSLKIQIMYRDHEYPDGDRIRVYVNDKIVQYDVTLEGEFQSFYIELVPGFNKIDFEALNQGTSGPNTAQFKVIDEKGNVISSKEWYLTTGFKASIVVTKD